MKSLSFTVDSCCNTKSEVSIVYCCLTCRNMPPFREYPTFRQIHMHIHTQRWLADNWLVWILCSLADDNGFYRSSLPGGHFGIHTFPPLISVIPSPSIGVSVLFFVLPPYFFSKQRHCMEPFLLCPWLSFSAHWIHMGILCIVSCILEIMSRV